MVIDFLIRFVKNANIQEMSKSRAHIAVTSFPKGFVKSQYEAGAAIVSQEEGGVSSWPSAV